MALLREYNYSDWNEKRERYEYTIGYFLTRTGYDFHRFKKTRTEFSCFKCRKKFPKGTRFIGTNYFKICFGCAKEFFENSKKEIKHIEESLSLNEEELKENKEKWEKELVLNVL